MGFYWGFIFGGFFGAIAAIVIMCVLKMGSWMDDLAERDNPKNIDKRIKK